MKAPLVEYQRVRDQILDEYKAKLPKAKRNRITSLSGLYGEIVREGEGSSVYTPRELAWELFLKTPKMDQARILDCSGGTGDLARPFFEAGLPVTLMDTDGLALAIAALENPQARICHEDFLKSTAKWDIIIGNPPYQGHKTMTMAQKAWLKIHFGEVMDNKSDLYNAFFAKSWSALEEGGILSFIVSRYWLESESAKLLRRYLLSRFRILYLHDWYGDRPFGAGVDPLLIILKKETAARDYTIPAVRQDIGAFAISSADLSEESMKLLTPRERRLRKIIESHTTRTLGDDGQFSQGIITGFDKAFITTREEAARNGVEAELLVPWVKSSDLEKTDHSKRLIYAQKEAGRYPGFMAYIEEHRTRLSLRREVKNGVRAFYELQWGRSRELFENRRILFPYKAPASRFVIAGGLFHSADIYSYTGKTDPEWLCALLNSPIYDGYIKTELKKLGRDLYEYYPHRLKKIRIPDMTIYPDPAVFLEKIQKELEDD